MNCYSSERPYLLRYPPPPFVTIFFFMALLCGRPDGVMGEEIKKESVQQALQETPVEQIVPPAVALPVVSDPRNMTFPSVSFTIPEIERMVLPNGIILYLLEDHELPLIHMQTAIRTGSLYEPADKIGLAAITGVVMRTGGAGSHTGDEVDKIADQLAAQLSMGIGLDVASGSLNLLKKDFTKGLALFADMLIHPAFEEEKLTLAKNNTIEAIRRRGDRPAGIASRGFSKSIYGATSPYARLSTEKTIQAISRLDLVQFHQTYFAPNNLMLGVTGDFDKKAMVKEIKAAFRGWKKKKVVLPSVVRGVEEKKGGVYSVDKAISQTQIRMGHLGIKQTNPDYYAVSIMNDILGGNGFSSRLFRDIRTTRGLAYSVGSIFSPGNFEPGVFLAYAETRTEATYQTISAMTEQIAKIRTELVTDEELRSAKDGFLNSFVFSFTDSTQIVARKMTTEYYRLPSNFLERFRDNVSKVTKEKVREAAEKYLHPDRLIIFSVGHEARFDRPLSGLGSVTAVLPE